MAPMIELNVPGNHLPYPQLAANWSNFPSPVRMPNRNLQHSTKGEADVAGLCMPSGPGRPKLHLAYSAAFRRYRLYTRPHEA
jgi:hypothetical protein